MKTLACLPVVCCLALAAPGCSSGGGADPGGGGSGGVTDGGVTDGNEDGGVTDGNEDGGVDAGVDAGGSDADSGDLESDTEAGGIKEECTASGYSDHACGVCMEAHCVGACEACVSDTDCMDWLICAQQCSDTACQDACTQQYPSGEAPALAWFGSSGCGWVECGDPCTSSTGGPYCDTGLTTNDPECDTCLNDNCCDAIKTCQADTACNDCLMNGTPDSCGGNASYAPLESCWSGTCGSACSGGESCGLSTNGANPACDTCIQTNCCDQGLTCVNGPDANQNGAPDCLDVLDCVQSCSTGDTACEDACNAAQPDGAALLDDFFGCLSQSCSMDCQ